MRNLLKKFKRIDILLVVLVAVVLCYETIGFALFNQTLNFKGVSKFKPDGIVSIVSLTYKDSSNATEKSAPTYNGLNLGFDVSYTVAEIEEEYYITYHMKVKNDSSYDYIFTGNNVSANINVEDGSFVDLALEGFNLGETIPAKSEIEFDVILSLYPNTSDTNYDVTTDVDIEAEDEVTGHLIAGVSYPSDKVGDLRGTNTLAHFKVDVSNTFNYQKSFQIFANSSTFDIVDQNGNALPQMKINANETGTYDFYVKLKDGALLPSSQEKLSILISSDNISNVSAGSVRLLVDINYVDDHNPPVIKNVSATQNSDDESVTVTWTGTDETSIDHYTVLAYKANNNQLVGTYNTDADENFINLTLAAGSYYFKVYGTDSSGNTATTSDINNATTSQGPCSKSTNYTFKWYATVTYDLSNLTNDGVTSVKLNDKLTVVLNASNGYNAPSSITVTMDGKTLSSRTDYTYRRSNNNKTGTLTINSVTGDVTIKASGTSTCLVEGTKIKLANGKYKNIEDINYYDLLEVWNFDRGDLSYEYPIWIEKENTTSSYQKTTFSDGSTLKTVGFHGVFNKDLNRFVSVDNIQEFHEGSNILKLDKDGKLTTVKVTKIETIFEEVKYYHVVSTRYYDIIANDFITTDGTVTLSNVYDFDNNLKWNNPINSNPYDYSVFSDIVPKYMYTGMRMKDANLLSKFNVDLNTFKYYLSKNQLNTSLYVKYPNIFGKNLYKVTIDNNSYYLLEGSKFTIPGTNKKYLNSLDNSILNSKDVITITNSIYLEEK